MVLLVTTDGTGFTQHRLPRIKPSKNNSLENMYYAISGPNVENI